MSYQPRLRKKYQEEIVPAMMEQFQYGSIMEVPRLVKVAINQGVGAATQDKKLVDSAVAELSMIAGQKAVVTRAKKSVSNFKLREGMPIGARVTLRHDRMWEFIERLVYVALPRVRDFRGISDKSFDGRGNYSMGVSEHIIFPEIDLDKVNKITGMDITFVTTAKTDAEALALLKLIGLPFKNQQRN
jgi:large subunit ribosomal protein L5